MNNHEQIKTVFLYSIFICYILLLIFIVFLSRASLLELFNSERNLYRSVNIIPFYSINQYISSGDSLSVIGSAFNNVIGNIIMFIPLGIYLILFKNDKRLVSNMFFIFVVSLFVETTQWLFGIGTSDIDDIILNCLGGLIGILGYKFFLFILKDEKKMRTIVTILSTIIGLPIVYVFIFVLRIKF